MIRKRSVPTARHFFCVISPQSGPGPRPVPIRSPKGNIQPAVVELEDNHLIAYCRRGGDYDPKTIGYIVRAESRDGGLTWSEGKDSAFPNPNAAVEFLKLKSGRLLLIFNDSMTRRTPLAAALSEDQDRTWTSRRNIREGEGDFGYPSAFQARDGRIHLVFTSERRTVVNHAVFDEDWVRSWPVKSIPRRSFAFQSDSWDLDLFVGAGLKLEFLDLIGGLVELDNDLLEFVHTATRPDLRRELLAIDVDCDEPHWLVLDVMSDRYRRTLLAWRSAY